LARIAISFLSPFVRNFQVQTNAAIVSSDFQPFARSRLAQASFSRARLPAGPTLLRGVRSFAGSRRVGLLDRLACWRGAWRGVQLLRRRLRADWARDVVNHGDVHGGGWGGALGLWRVEVAAAFFEDVDEELLDAAGVFGTVAEFVDDACEGAGYFVFVEAAAAHGVTDADARRRCGGDGARGDRRAVAEG
jgi:hypothetical protein